MNSASLRRLCLLTAFLLVAGLRAATLPADLGDLDAYIENVRREFQVPGVAIAIVKDGTVLLEKGYGVREMGRPAPVDAHTVFQIASNTKAFTGAALAMMVAEGKLKWDGRVIDYLPWFQMSDPYVTREMTVRDLLTHRSGLSLGAGDLLFWPDTTFTTKEIVQQLRHIPLGKSFRSAYAYDNILYAVAGLTLEVAAGQSWHDFMRDRIFAPIGMTESRASCSDLRPGDNVAIGHAKHNFTDLAPVPASSWDNNPAAGAICSTAHDMAKWLMLQLDAGSLPATAGQKSGRLYPAEQQHELWRLVTPITISKPAVPELAPVRPNFLGYALGWYVSDYRGQRLVGHTGGWPGQVSRVTLVPELKLGVVVLTNQEAGAAFHAVTWRVVDAFLGAPKKDWIAAYAAAVKKSEANADSSWARHKAARDVSAKPSLALGKYAGTYRDIWRGDVTVGLENGRLVMTFSKTTHLTGDLEHWHHDTFIVRWRERGLNADAFVTFSLTVDGAIDHAKMEAVSPLTDFSFDFHDLLLKPVTDRASVP